MTSNQVSPDVSPGNPGQSLAKQTQDPSDKTEPQNFDIVQTNKSENLTTDEAITKAGGFGRFQYFMLTVLILCMNSGGIIVYSIAFLQLQPIYNCKFKNLDEITEGCKVEDICNTDKVEWYVVDQDSIFSLHNWVTQLNLTCMPKANMGMIGALAFLGSATSCLFVPLFGDKYGRWFMMQVTMVSQIPLYVMLLFIHRLDIVYFLAFYLGVALIGRFSCGFILLSELCPQAYRMFAQTALCVGDSAIILFGCFFLRFVSGNTYILMAIGAVINVASFVAAYWIPESPEWLISQQRFQEAHKVYTYIAKFNKVKSFKIDSFEIENKARKTLFENTQLATQNGTTDDENKNTKKIVISEQKREGLCTDWTIIRNLLVLTVQWMASSVDYYMMTFYLKYVPGNIYANQSVNCISQMIAYSCSAFVFKKLGGKLSFIISYAITIVGGLCIMMFEHYGGLWMAFFVLLATFGISFAFNLVYMQTVPLFPTHVTSTAFGICNVFARFCTIVSPMIAEMDAPLPMVVYCATAGVAGIVVLFLKTDVKYD